MQSEYQKAAAQNVFIMAIGCLVMFALLVWGLGYAFDQHFQEQDTMLCSSAKVSGNVEMLSRCETYYVTGNPADIRQAGN